MSALRPHADDAPPAAPAGRLQRWHSALRAMPTEDWLKYGIVALVADRVGLFEMPYTVITRVTAALLRLLGL